MAHAQNHLHGGLIMWNNYVLFWRHWRRRLMANWIVTQGYGAYKLEPNLTTLDGLEKWEEEGLTTEELTERNPGRQPEKGILSQVLAASHTGRSQGGAPSAFVTVAQNTGAIFMVRHVQNDISWFFLAHPLPLYNCSSISKHFFHEFWWRGRAVESCQPARCATLIRLGHAITVIAYRKILESMNYCRKN